MLACFTARGTFRRAIELKWAIRSPHKMRSFLLATSAAALALAFSGPVSAAPDKSPEATIAPQKGADTGLVFSKNTGQARPIEQAKSGEQTPLTAAKPA